jgi:hypothetical protein
MNAPSGPIRSAPTVYHLIWGARTPGSRHFHHAPVARAARPLQFIVGKRSDSDAGADGVDPRAALFPTNGFGHHPERVPRLDSW